MKASLDFYKKHGFEIDFIIQEKVPLKKKFLYKNNPTKVKSFFLKHKFVKMIKIELLSHNRVDTSHYNNFKLKIYSPHIIKKIFLKDPDNNEILFDKKKIFRQELLIYVSNWLKTAKYLIANYSDRNLSKNIKPFYYFKSNLIKEWSLKIKIKQVNNKKTLFLNSLGLTCISFISLFKKKISYYEIFKVIKKNNNKINTARLSFNKSNRFLIEEYFDYRS